MNIFDLHCDTAFECECALSGRSIDKGAHHISLGRGEYLSKWCQIFAIFMPDEYRGAAARNHYLRVRDYIYAQARLFPDRFILCRDAKGLAQEVPSGACKVIMSVEGGSAAAGSLDNIRTMYDDGVRLMTLTWNIENEIACGVKSEKKGGLTQFGEAAVKLMNELDMIVDVSHLSDEGFYHVAQVAKKPFVASHSCSRALCAHPRNLTDDMFAVVRDVGGMVGINFSRGFLRDDSNATIDDILRHTEHFLSLGGENVVCMGSDFDGTDMPDGVTGVESMGDIYERFLRANYSESLVSKIFWGNADAFFTKALTHSF